MNNDTLEDPLFPQPLSLRCKESRSSWRGGGGSGVKVNPLEQHLKL